MGGVKVIEITQRQANSGADRRPAHFEKGRLAGEERQAFGRGATGDARL